MINKRAKFEFKSENYVIFVDNNDSYFAITKEGHQCVLELLKEYDREYNNIPDDKVVKAYPIKQVNEDEMNTPIYDFAGDSLDFPVNKIKKILMTEFR